MNNYSNVVNRFNPAPSSQSTGKDMDSTDVLALRIQRCLERTKLIANLVRNSRAVAEHGLRHSSASFLASLFIKNEASLPNKPSQETTKGVKCLLCSKQASRCLRFFSFSADFNVEEGWRARYEGWFASHMRILIIQSVWWSQKPQTRRSPRSYTSIEMSVVLSFKSDVV